MCTHIHMFTHMIFAGPSAQCMLDHNFAAPSAQCVLDTVLFDVGLFETDGVYLSLLIVALFTLVWAVYVFNQPRTAGDNRLQTTHDSEKLAPGTNRRDERQRQNETPSNHKQQMQIKMQIL